jgi:hypothetical protein
MWFGPNGDMRDIVSFKSPVLIGVSSTSRGLAYERTSQATRNKVRNHESCDQVSLGIPGDQSQNTSIEALKERMFPRMPSIVVDRQPFPEPVSHSRKRAKTVEWEQPNRILSIRSRRLGSRTSCDRALLQLRFCMR